MVYPSLDKFNQLSEEHTKIVVYREIVGDTITPINLLSNYSDEKYLFLLESANLDKSFSRYTFFGLQPKKIIIYKNGKLTIETEDGGIEEIDKNPIQFLMKELENIDSHKDSEKGNFCGGFVGFIGYDMVNHMDILREAVEEDSENLSMAFFQVDEFYVFDNNMRKLYAACSVEPKNNPEELYNYASERTLEMAIEILNCHKKVLQSDENVNQTEDFDKESYIEAVKKLKEEIIAGECIQTVLSNKYTINCTINPINMYRVLRNINPSPYMFYLKFENDIICGTSPEVHLKISDKKAMLKPIAGTYKFDEKNLEEIKLKLLNDEKERAEHLMLLDLARNDLYTGCRPDSVRVLESFVPEVYSHVVHIVSEVEGELLDDMNPIRLFCNTFPAGTVSGAPKVRAMELIDKYEKSPRGFYSGCAGYFSYSQDIDTCILIRSAYINKEAVVLRAGAGIVYDSNPESEYYEVGNKLGALFDALQQISFLEKKNVFNDR